MRTLIRWLLTTSIFAAACGGGSSTGRITLPTSAREARCELVSDHGRSLETTCFPANGARVAAIALDPSGDIVLLGALAGNVTIGQPLASGGDDPFLARLAPNRSARWSIRLDAPGWARGLAADAGGVTVVTGTMGDAGERSFFTRVDARGRAVVRRELGFAGYASSMALDPWGQLVVRQELGGTRIAKVSREGAVLGSIAVGVPYAHTFPASLRTDTSASEIGVEADGSVVVPHGLGPSPTPGAAEQGLTRVASDGRVVWMHPHQLGKNVQLAVHPRGYALLAAPSILPCKGTVSGDTLAVALVDKNGGRVWDRCFRAHTSGARFVVDGRGVVTVAGQVTGANDFSGGAPTPGRLASFVLRLDADGRTLSSDIFGDRRLFVASQALAAEASGRVVFAGTIGRDEGDGSPERGWMTLTQTHVFVATLEP